MNFSTKEIYTMINKVTLIGRLGQDPEVRRLENGAAVAKLNLATNERYRDKNGEWQELTEWHRVILWRWLAERAEQSLKKGSLVYIDGKLTTRKWQDNNGNERYTTEVVANTFRALERREDGSGSGYTSSFPGVTDAPPANQRTSAPAPANPATTEPVTTDSTVDAAAPAADAAEDDLPF